MAQVGKDLAILSIDESYYNRARIRQGGIEQNVLHSNLLVGEALRAELAASLQAAGWRVRLVNVKREPNGGVLPDSVPPGSEPFLDMIIIMSGYYVPDRQPRIFVSYSVIGKDWTPLATQRVNCGPEFQKPLLTGQHDIVELSRGQASRQWIKDTVPLEEASAADVDSGLMSCVKTIANYLGNQLMQ